MNPTPTVTSTWTPEQIKEKAALIHQGVCDCRGEMTCGGGRRAGMALASVSGSGTLGSKSRPTHRSQSEK